MKDKSESDEGVPLLLECATETPTVSQQFYKNVKLDNIKKLQQILQNPNSPIQFTQQNGNVNGFSSKRNSYRGKYQNRNSNHIPESQPTRQTNQSPILSQSLRAHRKVTANATVTPPAVNETPAPTPAVQSNNNNDDDDDEIEVVEDTRSSTNGLSDAARRSALQPTQKDGRKAGQAVSRPAKPETANTPILLNINIRPRNLAPVNVNSVKRKELDTKVKVVLMKSPSEFVEWLLRFGLIRSQQFCNIHKTASRRPSNLKLGMFSDPKVLVSSGGYVWIGDCCGGRKYISVYSGSIFGATPIDKIAPTSVLKLIYHWSCQTAVNNVETWVKVTKHYISKLYTYFRCTCSVILHDKVFDFGIQNSNVELGIVSLGTTTTDGVRKAVKVEILGVYDRHTDSYRLFASTPEHTNNARERFFRILKPVREVVHKNARIICDQSIDPTCLHALGFLHVEVCYTSDKEGDFSTNSTIMYYLRKHVPRIFQSALSYLSEHQIQLAIDELCWREKFATTSYDAYNNLIDNIAYLTGREIENPGLLPLLDFVCEVPHQNFRYKVHFEPKTAPTLPIMLNSASLPLTVVPSLYNSGKALVMNNKVLTNKTDSVINNSPMSPGLAQIASKQPSLPPQLNILHTNCVNQNDDRQLSPVITKTNDFVDVEPYFYGRIAGNASLGQEYNDYNFKCHLCGDVYEENVMFYAHVKAHYNGTDVSNTAVQLTCPYCNLPPFQSLAELSDHKTQKHWMTSMTEMWCRICSQTFTSETLLKSHMMRKHVEAELPYRCEICHFCTSFYYEIIDHFAQSHRNTPYIMCHICLAMKTLTPNGASSFSQRLFQHLQKHSSKINCKSCVLSFYSNYLLNEHRKEHLSCVNVKGVTKYEPPSGYRVMQFKPNLRSMGVTTTNNNVFKTGKAAMSITAETCENLTLLLREGEEAYFCFECEAPMDVENHFSQYRKCTKCQYSSSCQNMMVKHHQVFHPGGSKKPLYYVIGNPVVLDEPLQCSCGFSSMSGHHMANHLSACNDSTRTAYPVGGGHRRDDSDDEGPAKKRRLEETLEIEGSDNEDFLMPVSVEIEEE